LLAAFEEQHWARRIDDPLPPGRVDRKERLHDTIKRLNRHQRHRLLHFGGDGTSEGVYWRPIHVARFWPSR
jgi:hypothetical protein